MPVKWKNRKLDNFEFNQIINYYNKPKIFECLIRLQFNSGEIFTLNSFYEWHRFWKISEWLNRNFQINLEIKTVYHVFCKRVRVETKNQHACPNSCEYLVLNSQLARIMDASFVHYFVYLSHLSVPSRQVS